MKVNIGKDLYLHGRIGWKGLNISEYIPQSDYRIINATSLMDGYVNWNNCGFITKERYDESEEIKLKENDILISKDGTLGKIGYVKNMISKCTVAAGIFVLRNTIPEILDFDYLYHLLKSNIFKNFIKNFKAAGSTINHLYQVDLEHFEIEVPPIQEQRNIAHILSSLDNKIALNRSINRNLEAMAKQLYDYWFVQFDFPDENGRPYKSSGGKMVWNEILKREIPEGWEVKKLQSCIKHINTGLNPRQNFTFGGNIKYITVKNLTINGNIDFSGCDTIDNEARAKVHKRSQIEKGDILYASICPLGRTHLITKDPADWDINESVFSIRPDCSVLNSEYLNMLLKDDYYTRKFSQKSTGSIFLGIRINELNNTEILVPSKNVLDKFCKLVSPINEAQALLQEEVLRITALRDELLPLLMNGQVEVTPLNSDLSEH